MAVVDVLSSLLNDVRADGALFGQSVLRPPWSVRFAQRAPLTMVLMVQGRSWLLTGEDVPVPLGVGDVAIVVGDAPFALADEPDTALPPRYVVRDPGHAGEVDPADGHQVLADPRLGVRTCDDPAPEDGSAVVLVGSYRVAGPVSDRLLGALPRLVLVPDEGDLCPVMDLTFAEIGRDMPGQQAVLDRLLDLLLLTTLREWFDRPEAQPPAWYRALGDPIVGLALRLIHEAPAYPWTVAALAAEAGVSRATLARRFTELVGDPPMTYLTTWRLTVAADLLRRTDATVDAIARQVGYVSGYGLSVAFKRVLGSRPSDFRGTTRLQEVVTRSHPLQTGSASITLM
jgi:AraC-like DNA-binding protein